jgi:transaldolase
LLRRYIDELSVTGLTSNPTIFDHAIKNSTDYDVAIREKLEEGKSGEQLFFELALEDLTRAADLFRPIYDQTCGMDGWVSLEVSPLLAHDNKTTLAASFVKSWNELMAVIVSKSAALQKAGSR